MKPENANMKVIILEGTAEAVECILLKLYGDGKQFTEPVWYRCGQHDPCQRQTKTIEPDYCADLATTHAISQPSDQEHIKNQSNHRPELHIKTRQSGRPPRKKNIEELVLKYAKEQIDITGSINKTHLAERVGLTDSTIHYHLNKPHIKKELEKTIAEHEEQKYKPLHINNTRSEYEEGKLEGELPT
jgi:hypothetical protein